MKTNFTKNPAFRKLRAYAFDPSISLDLDTASINKITHSIAWEKLAAGPIGEYIEVVDYDPTVKQFYAPVDLNDPFILAQNGLPPSESNPQFHQQMVYAVAMTTIQNYERALGRKILWSTRLLESRAQYEEYVQRLRIYPHALREANAYYSPHKKALLFGYFSSTPANSVLHMPDALVFTCLSHDIIAHEVTHAILDGMNRNYNMPTNPDVLAFHEAFADIVALFQHFTFPEVLKHQIAKTRGDLASQNLLGQLAQELGSAIGGYGSLRDALGGIDPQTKEWRPKTPNPSDYRNLREPHSRGGILVAAIFEAFISIYKRRVEDLLRIASNGSGILPVGELHPDLVNRLAREASKAARHILTMCIRALDYCPPVDITFGDYLRALITADLDLVEEDGLDYRLAIVDAFRKRGIYPKGIKTLSIESLAYKDLNIGYQYDERGLIADLPGESNLEVDETTRRLLAVINDFLRDYGDKIKYVNDRKAIYLKTKEYIGGKYDDPDEFILGLHKRITGKFSNSIDFSKITGLAFFNDFDSLGLRPSGYSSSVPSFQIQNLRLVSRVGPGGRQANQVVFSIIQKSGVAVGKNGQFTRHYVPGRDKPWSGAYEFYAGCTLIFDLDTQTLKYAISKPLLDLELLEQGKYEIHKKRVEEQYRHLFGEGLLHMSEYNKYFGMGLHNYQLGESFALLHHT